VKWTKECGERLRKLRKMRGLTLGQLSDRTKWARAMLSDFERAEEMPTKDDLYGLAKVLCVTWEYLAGLRTTEPPEYRLKPRPGNEPFGVAEQWEKEVDGVSTAADVSAYVHSQRRDMFAAAALTGLVARGQEPSTVGTTKMAWKYADAMLEDET
jgi:transcriptional regulator with XRE-family HTH domain